eukprot:4825025-Prymnesium_polylepis.1
MHVPMRFSQRTLSAAFHRARWLVLKEACDAFDAENAAATVLHREATGFVSSSRAGSGALVHGSHGCPTSPSRA